MIADDLTPILDSASKSRSTLSGPYPWTRLTIVLSASISSELAMESAMELPPTMVLSKIVRSNPTRAYRYANGGCSPEACNQ